MDSLPEGNGTAHATNAVVKSGAFRWLEGEDTVVRYDLPMARSFATSFCRNCGSPLAHLTRSGQEVSCRLVPSMMIRRANPNITSKWASRASWFAHGEALLKIE